MSNASDIAIVGIIATLGAIAVVASFGRRRRRRKALHQPSILDISDYATTTSAINDGPILDCVMEHEHEPQTAPLFFYNFLAAYSSVASSSKTSPKRFISEPIYSTWAKHAARGEDEIVVEGPIPYLISNDSAEFSGTSSATPGHTKFKELVGIDHELKALRQRIFQNSQDPGR